MSKNNRKNKNNMIKKSSGTKAGARANGFPFAERRSIIVLVVAAAIFLVAFFTIYSWDFLEG